MTALLLVGFLGSFAMAWWSMFRVLPDAAMSRLRYRLWWIRDSVAIEIIDDVYENRDEPLKFIREVEAVIHAAPHLTFLRFWILRRLGRNIEKPPYEGVNFDVLSDEDRQRLEIWKYHLDRAVIWHSLIGSVLGWFALAVFVAFVYPRELLRGIFQTKDETPPGEPVPAGPEDPPDSVDYVNGTHTDGEQAHPKWHLEHGDPEESGWSHVAFENTKNVVHDEFEVAVEPILAYAASGVALPWDKKLRSPDPVAGATT